MTVRVTFLPEESEQSAFGPNISATLGFILTGFDKNVW
jgi:hypothetical protein